MLAVACRCMLRDVQQTALVFPPLPPWHGLHLWQVITAAGFELARVALVDGQGRLLLDELVLPQRPVLDHNTQFSGEGPREGGWGQGEQRGGSQASMAHRIEMC